MTFGGKGFDLATFGKDAGPDAVKGNHIFDAWVYVKLSEHDNSEVVLGTTVHTAVITVVHF